VNVTVGGRRIRALALITKQGFAYVFDRVTGEPVWPIEERKVLPSDVPGERAAPTQPFPTKPAPFEYQGVTTDDLVDFTPEVRALAMKAIQGFRLGPLFTPPSLEGTIQRPGTGGGGNWSGAAVDPETGMLYVPSRQGWAVNRVVPPEPELKSNLRYVQRQRGSPALPQGLPLFKPPYSRMTAINMNTGEHAWMTPTGNGNRVRSIPMLKGLNLPPVGGDTTTSGPLLTKTLLMYALTTGGSNDGPRLVAYDKTSGKEIASADLPGTAIGTPMTYLIDGRQYLALTVQPPGDNVLPELVALTVEK
jgi:quinoprotein glucose dehydrogenase